MQLPLGGERITLRMRLRILWSIIVGFLEVWIWTIDYRLRFR